MTTRRPVSCIIPIHMTEALEKHGGALGEAARNTMLASVRLRERRSLLGTLAMATPAGQKRRTVYDAQHGTALPGKLVRGEDDPKTGDVSVSEAFDGLGATYDLYRDVYKRNSIDGKGMRLDATVHYGEEFMNAFWDGRQMVFGDGDGEVFQSFTASIDIIGHELTHGVVQHTADLAYHRQAGALNESFADVFGSLVKQYAKKQTAAQADWLIGAELLGPNVDGTALRSMKAPGTAYDDPRLGKDPQPDHMSGYQNLPDTDFGDWGGVHVNSGIPNKAFYNLAAALGGYAWERAGRIWYGGLLRLWSAAGFQDCAEVMAEVAGTLYGETSEERKAVIEAWSKVGLTVSPAGMSATRRDAIGMPQPDQLHGVVIELVAQLRRITTEVERALSRVA